MLKRKGDIMSVFRVEKNNNYTVMANYHLRDKELSFKAKGLLSYMLSLPENWDYSLNGLARVSKEGIKAIKNIINELKEKGYLKINRLRKENGQYQYEYLIREIPEGIEPEYQKGYAVKGESEKGIQINTNNKKDKIDINDKTQALENPFVIDLIKSGYISDDEYNLSFYDDFFQDLLSKGYDKIKIYSVIHYIVPRVLKSNFKDDKGCEISNKFAYLKSSVSSNLKRFEQTAESLYDDLEDYDWLNDFKNSSSKEEYEL